MAGLDSMQYTNYQANMPDELKVGMAPLNALWQGQEEAQMRRSRNNTLQNQQYELQQSALQGALAQNMNTPENIATLNQGKLGEAISKSNEGALSTAQLPSKQQQADLDLIKNVIEKEAYKADILGPNYTPNSVSHPAILQSLTKRKQATGKPWNEVLKGMLGDIDKTRNSRIEAEAMAKSAPQLAEKELGAVVDMEEMRSRERIAEDTAQARREAKDADIRARREAKDADIRSSEEKKRSDARLLMAETSRRADDFYEKYLIDYKDAGDNSSAKATALGIFKGRIRALNSEEPAKYAEYGLTYSPKFVREDGTIGETSPKESKSSLTPEQRAAIIQRLTGGK